MRCLEDPLLHTADLSQAHLISEIPAHQTADGKRIGYMPALAATGLRHGFSWDTTNFSFRDEPGFPENEALDQIIQRQTAFMSALGMAALRDSIHVNTSPGDIGIGNINRLALQILELTNVKTERGAFIGGVGAIFTDIPELPLYALAGDCTWTFVKATSWRGTPVAGLIHAGRFEAGERFPHHAILHLIEEYGCQPEDITVGIIPGLGLTHHTIDAEHIKSFVGDPTAWEPYMMRNDNGDIRLDQRGMIADQYIEAGIPAANLSLCLADTYTAAEAGYGFSHRLTRSTGATAGRFIVACQL